MFCRRQVVDRSTVGRAPAISRGKTWRLRLGALVFGCSAVATAACGGTTINQNGTYNQTCEKSSSCSADIGDLTKIKNSRNAIVWAYQYMPSKTVLTAADTKTLPSQP